MMGRVGVFATDHFFPSALHVVSNIERLSIQLILTRWNINMFLGTFQQTMEFE